MIFVQNVHHLNLQTQLSDHMGFTKRKEEDASVDARYAHLFSRNALKIMHQLTTPEFRPRGIHPEY